MRISELVFRDADVADQGERFRNFHADDSDAGGPCDGLQNPGLGKVKEMGKGWIEREKWLREATHRQTQVGHGDLG